ncbi:MAG TPA: outer membrane beta-barrel protein [Flavisolibacter sp.]|jgi:hypothetical protein
MRKIVLLLCSVSVFTLFASAQITKGSKLLGGGIGFGGSRSDPPFSSYSKQANASVGISVGVAIKENLVAGGSLSYGHASSNYHVPSGSPDTRNTGNNYGAGTFLRRYVPLGKNFYLFGQAGLDFGISNQEQVASATTKTKSKGWNVSLNAAPGISYALTRKFQLELGFNNLASLYYGKSTSETTGTGAPAGGDKGKSSSYGLSTSLGTSTPLNIGFRFLLQK